jgi:ribosomal protein S18 acetylase RimI-like enzyme
MTTSLVRTRRAAVDDLGPVRDLYDRCSPQTLERRFHAPFARIPDRVVRQLVEPRDGWSLVAVQGEEVIGHGCAGKVAPGTVEVGLIVDDAFQGTGVGTRLMRDLAGSAAARGFRSMLCVVEPDNEAVLRTVQRAGLDGVPDLVDGLVEIRVELPTRTRELQQPA